MIEKFLENFLIKLRDASRGYQESILSGSFRTFEEYKFISGKLNGMQEVEDMLKKFYQDLIERVDLKDIRSIEDADDQPELY